MAVNDRQQRATTNQSPANGTGAIDTTNQGTCSARTPKSLLSLALSLSLPLSRRAPCTTTHLAKARLECFSAAGSSASQTKV